MSNTRLYFILAVAILCTLAFAAPAFAWTHGQFSVTTDACAGCHVAHAAQAPNLLKAGSTQTQFCFLCHGDGATSAPYDVKDGYTSIDKGTTKVPSTAGGFINQWNGTAEVAVTSRHSVWGLIGESGYPTAEDQKQFFIPGGTNQFTGSGFVCASCHDPHAGGGTPTTVKDYANNDITNSIRGDASNANPRLLRKAITVQDAAYTDLYVWFRFETVGTFTYRSVDSGVYRVIEYKDGSAKWCGACHNKFRTLNLQGGVYPQGPGHANYYFGMWRHPMDAHVLPVDGSDYSIATGTPWEMPRSVYHVACLTCHRAHSTTVSAEGWAASWPRDAGGTSTTSALLRMDNRGVCYNCHGAGQYNCWNDHRLVLASDKVSYIPMDCSKCHPRSDHFYGGGYDCSVCHH